MSPGLRPFTMQVAQAAHHVCFGMQNLALHTMLLIATAVSLGKPLQVLANIQA